MNRLRCLVVLISFIVLCGPAFGQSPDVVTAKVNVGWNAWILGSALVTSSVTGINAGGLSFGADLLLGSRNKFQYGLGAAYLPMFVATAAGQSVSLSMIPIVAEVCFNNAGPFYADAGLGVAFLKASATSGITDAFNVSAFSPSPGFLAKFGLGFDFKVNRLLGIDIGADAYLPFSDFGLTGSQSNAALDLVAFSQFNLRAGVSISF